MTGENKGFDASEKIKSMVTQEKLNGLKNGMENEVIIQGEIEDYAGRPERYEMCEDFTDGDFTIEEIVKRLNARGKILSIKYIEINGILKEGEEQ